MKMNDLPTALTPRLLLTSNELQVSHKWNLYKNKTYMVIMMLRLPFLRTNILRIPIRSRCIYIFGVACISELNAALRVSVNKDQMQEHFTVLV